MSRILLIGGGDLGQRIGAHLVRRDEVSELVVAARDAVRGSSVAGLLDASGSVRTRYVHLDALDQVACERVLRVERPDLVVHCACFISPWEVAAAETPQLRTLGKCGFALQLPFQLATIFTVMSAAREVSFSGAIVNCSYPDVTNVVLARGGLAPTVGIGNVGMMQARVEATQRASTGQVSLVRMVAHHAVTVAVMTNQPTPVDEQPIVCVGEEGEIMNHLTWLGSPIAWSRETNSLAAAVAIRVICALLPGGTPTRTSAPGPLGLHGGYPVRVSNAGISLDLPATVPLETALARNETMARRDGVERIEADGAVVFTEALANRLKLLRGDYASPLTLQNMMSRAKDLARVLGLG